MLSLVLVPFEASLSRHFDVLVESQRAVSVELVGGQRFWCATERRKTVESLHPGILFAPDTRLNGALLDETPPEREAAILTLLRGQVEISGPVQARFLSECFGLEESDVLIGLGALEAEGLLLRGDFEPSVDGEQFCARRLLARIHTYTRDRCAGKSSRFPLKTSFVFFCAGSMSRQAQRARVAPVWPPWSSSCRVSRLRREPGSRRSSLLG